MALTNSKLLYSLLIPTFFSIRSAVIRLGDGGLGKDTSSFCNSGISLLISFPTNSESIWADFTSIPISLALRYEVMNPGI